MKRILTFLLMFPFVGISMGTIYFLGFMILPFTNIDINELNGTKMDIKDLEKINIKLISDETLFGYLVFKYLPSLAHSQGAYYRSINTIYLGDVGVNKNKENLYETLFHEYLHYVYQNKMKEKMNYFNQDDFVEIVTTIKKTDFDLLLTHILATHNNIYYGLTEYISHNYSGYLYYCKDTRDDITDILIEKELLPKTIYCKDVSNESEVYTKIKQIIKYQKEIDYLRETIKN